VLLPPIILAIAEQRWLDAVLSAIAAAVASQPDVALRVADVRHC
jgi:hypothetical protein